MKLIFICCYIIFALKARNCDQTRKHCNDLLYKELGCEVMSYGKNGNPDNYHCPKHKVDSECCKYRGVQYNLGDPVHDPNLPRCHLGCHCKAGFNFISSIQCNQPECVHPVCPATCPDCYAAYQDFHECCPSIAKCPSTKAVATCTINNIVYKEGQLFYPDKSCKECLCQDGFNGKLIEPFCKDINCGVELKFSTKIKNKCAPIYRKDACCPDSFLCPRDIPSIIVNTPDNKRNLKAACYFGCNRILLDGYFDANFTEYKSGKNIDITCSCDVPPYLKCIKV